MWPDGFKSKKNELFRSAGCASCQSLIFSASNSCLLLNVSMWASSSLPRHLYHVWFYQDMCTSFVVRDLWGHVLRAVSQEETSGRGGNFNGIRTDNAQCLRLPSHSLHLKFGVWPSLSSLHKWMHRQQKWQAAVPCQRHLAQSSRVKTCHLSHLFMWDCGVSRPLTIKVQLKSLLMCDPCLGHIV